MVYSKEQRKQYNKEYRLKNKEKLKEYRLINKEKLKEYRLINKEKIKEQKKEYRLKNKEKTKKYNKEYRLINKEKIKEQKKSWFLKMKKQNYFKKYRAEKKVYFQKYRQTEKFKKCHRISHWKRYGLIDHYNDNYNTLYKIYTIQKMCGICFKLFNTEKVMDYKCLDHDHKTGLIRRICCGYCNLHIIK